MITSRFCRIIRIDIGLNVSEPISLYITYAGAGHGFTNPEADKYGADFNLPLGYNAEVDQKSWADMQRFLKEVFEK